MHSIFGSLGILASAILAFQAPMVTTYGGFSMSQTIDSPPAQVGFIDQNNETINSPNLDFPVQTSSLKCLTYTDGAPKTILGTADEQLFVSIPGDYNAWSLSIIDGGEWESPTTDKKFTLNDDYSEGCLPNPQETYRENSLGGLMYIDPTNISLNNDCLYSCDDSGLELGEFTNFAASEDFKIPLLFSNVTDKAWQGTIGNIVLTQTIPANLPPAEYSVYMSLILELI